jgi:hypothetical protein
MSGPALTNCKVKLLTMDRARRPCIPWLLVNGLRVGPSTKMASNKEQISGVFVHKHGTRNNTREYMKYCTYIYIYIYIILYIYIYIHKNHIVCVVR